MQPLIDVEYLTAGGTMRTATKRGQIYCGVVERPSDGLTCLAILDPGATRCHLIEVGHVAAINGYELATDPDRWRTRAQEIRLLVEGECEEWAKQPIAEAYGLTHRPQTVFSGVRSWLDRVFAP
jgi:hypothetical protein